jgi:hypothetical protein
LDYLTTHTSLITNTAWVLARLCKLQKGCTRLAAASDKVYQLLAHGRWFSPASSTTKTGRHDIAEILLKVALNTHQKSKSINHHLVYILFIACLLFIQNTTKRVESLTSFYFPTFKKHQSIPYTCFMTCSEAF